MYVSDIEVTNVRNLANKKIELSPQVNILVGDNAHGKTNLLEAIYFSGTGRSHRTHINREMIEYEKDFAHIQTNVEDFSSNRIDMHIKRDGRTGARINGLNIPKLGDLLGVLQVVIFSPEDLSLVREGPAVRRRFMDMEICQISAVYYTELQQYHQVLQQRNSLLKTIQKKKEKTVSEKDTEALKIWDEQLIHYGLKVQEKRERFVEQMNDLSKPIHKGITKTEELELIYDPFVKKEEYREKVSGGHERDIRMGTTFYGVHKDDIIFMIDGKDVKQYGSQGQTRTAALSVKLAEIKLIQEVRKKDPVLLLDDVFSELDENRQKALLSSTKNIQTIITCTGVESILYDASRDVAFFDVRDGHITRRYE